MPRPALQRYCWILVENPIDSSEVLIAEMGFCASAKLAQAKLA